MRSRAHRLVERVPSWLRFLVVGALNTAIFGVLFWLFQPSLGSTMANVVAFVLATGTGYVLHGRLTFGNRAPRTMSRFLGFAVVQTSALVVSTVALAVVATGRRTVDLAVALALQVGVALLRFLVLRGTVFAEGEALRDD